MNLDLKQILVSCTSVTSYQLVYSSHFGIGSGAVAYAGYDVIKHG